MAITWQDVAKTVGAAAPLLGTALGGPLGGALGSLLANAFGVTNSPDAISAAIASDPAAAEKLAEVESNNKVQLQQLTVQAQTAQLAADTAQYQAEVADRTSARQRQSANPKDMTSTVLAYLVVGAFVGMVAAMLSGWSHVDSALAGTLIGYLSAKAEQIIAYYFGSSKDSAGKTQMIADVGYAAAGAPITIHNGAQAVPATTTTVKTASNPPQTVTTTTGATVEPPTPVAPTLSERLNFQGGA